MDQFALEFGATKQERLTWFVVNADKAKLEGRSIPIEVRIRIIPIWTGRPTPTPIMGPNHFGLTQRSINGRITR